MGRLSFQADHLSSSTSEIIMAAQNLSMIADGLTTTMGRFKT
jgi:hypothetical protein